MPRIDIRRPHALPPDQARAVVDKVAERMREKFDMQIRWHGESLHFSRPGVKGTIAVAPGSVHVTAELGLMLAPLAGLVEQEIRRKLDEHFGNAP